MPPWYASPGIGKFSNDRTMPAADRKLLLAWLTLARSRGLKIAQSAPGKQTARSRAIGVWITRRPVGRARSGTWASPTGSRSAVHLRRPGRRLRRLQVHASARRCSCTTRTLQAAEVQPSNPRVVHHSNLGYMPIGTQGMYARLITGYVPGVGPMQLDNGVASKIPAGSVTGLQIHLTTTGKPEKTKFRVGFRFPRYKVDKELHYLQLSNQHLPFRRSRPTTRSRGRKRWRTTSRSTASSPTCTFARPGHDVPRISRRMPNPLRC